MFKIFNLIYGKIIFQKSKKKKSSNKSSKNANPVIILQEASRKLGMNALAKR